MVAACLLSTFVLRYEGAFPLTIFLTSLCGIVILTKFKVIEHDDRIECRRLI